MSLRPEYSLGRSEFNEFLWSPTGIEEHGAPLTVLSALTRLGLDPWKEAARLTALPRDSAVTALASLISRHQSLGDSARNHGEAARRLVTLLQERPMADGGPASAQASAPASRVLIGLIVALAAVALLGVILRGVSAQPESVGPPFGYERPVL